MNQEYEIKLWEDKIERDSEGRVTHHPLNSRYFLSHGKDVPSFGHLTFGGHDLDRSTLLSDIRVFYLQFFGETDPVQDQEAWADPLRAKVLQHLSHEKRSWYLGIIPHMLDGRNPTDPMPIEKERGRWQGLLGSDQIEFATIQSEMPYGYGRGFLPRFFLEIPNQSLTRIVTHYWPEAIPGDPVEGYNMATGQIELLREWGKRPRDDQLFREVMDQIFVAFYTFPAEHRDFVFVTNKLDLEDIRQLIDVESLQRKANEIEQQAFTQT